MLNNEQITLSKYRMEKADECLSSAKHLLEIDDYSATANRSYYAVFHTIRAIMTLDGEDRKKHSGVISYFLENYIKTGIFEKKYSYVIKSAFDVRQESDYEDFFIISKSDVQEQIKNVAEFIDATKKYLENRYNEK
ncbi:MAG: HEPN domain-containing protein [Clostridia bacterium]|nr:HEPN domain-containing protein [Clostridia bacterium]